MIPAKILVVGIGQPVQPIFIAALEETGYKPNISGSASETLTDLASEKYDVLLIDSSGPVFDAVCLCAKSKEMYPDIPVIIMATERELGPALAALRSGAFDYLPKPVERMHLLSVVNKASEHRRMGKEANAYRGNLESLAATRNEQLIRVTEDLAAARESVINLLAEMVEARRLETRNHAEYVTAFAVALGRIMGLSRQQNRVIARAAFLHNVGMAFMPDIIVQQDLFSTHALHGWLVLKKAGLPEEAELVYTHEEHFDGNGHPRALKGEQIPLGARIIALAHFVAELIGKTGKIRVPSAEIRNKVELQSGNRFDPEVVNAFLSAPEMLWTDLCNGIDSRQTTVN